MLYEKICNKHNTNNTNNKANIDKIYGKFLEKTTYRRQGRDQEKFRVIFRLWSVEALVLYPKEK
jgi:hypothetical protein